MNNYYRPFAVRMALAAALVSMALIAPVQAENTAIKPAPRDAKWVARHEGFVAEAKQGGVDLLFLGDSITDGWRSKGKAVWDKYWAPLHAVNFGIGGDRTQHVLWRMENGELVGIKPKAVVLMIGTNNTGKEKDGNPRNTTPEIIEGVTAIVKGLRAKLPTTKVLLLAVFPRGEQANNPIRAQLKEINDAIARLDDGKNVKFLDIGAKFLAADGILPKDIMPDFLHPNAQGYEIWAQAIEGSVKQLMK